MQIAPLPENEQERLAVLADYHILDTAAESIFDKITDIASNICGVPICLISLIDKDRQWFKSNHGMGDKTEGPRDTAFCSHAILDDKIMEVNDATKDKRFTDNPFVTEDPNIRFYAGMPLITPHGFKLGTLCVIDNEPKSLTDDQRENLQNLADIIMTFFEIKKSILGDINQRKLASEALASANAKLKKKLTEQKQSRQDLILLGEMSSILQACMTPKEAYGVISKFSQRLFPDTRGSLYLLQGSSNQVERIATWNEDVEQPSFFSLNECWALRRGQAHYVTDPQQDLICEHMSTYDPIPPYFCMPLMAQGEILGLICLQYIGPHSDLSEPRRLLAVAMAEQAALALANAKLRQTLHLQSITDPLTGLYNRRYLTETLKSTLPRLEKKQATMAFILVDIDHFKLFNDTYGHDAGDVVLIEVANLLSRVIKEKGQGQACRFGGEEFIAIFHDIHLEEAIQQAELLRTAVQQIKITHNNVLLPAITLSLGIAMYPEHGNSIDVLFKAADTALYQAKETGRNRLIVYKASL